MRHPGRSGHARLNARNDAFKTGDTVALKTIKANLNQAVRLTKCTYGQKAGPFQAPHKHQKTVAGAPEKNIGFLNYLKNSLGRFKAKQQQKKM